MLRKFFAVPILLVLLTLAASAQSAKVEPVGALADSSAAESLKKAVEEKGYRVTLPDGTVVCDLWLRKSLPAAEKSEVSGVSYSEIPVSAVIAVVSFAKPTTDFRGQDLARERNQFLAANGGLHSKLHKLVAGSLRNA